MEDKIISTISAGYNHAAALTTSGEMWTWGCNDSGQLGLNDCTQRLFPTLVCVHVYYEKIDRSGSTIYYVNDIESDTHLYREGKKKGSICSFVANHHLLIFFYGQ